MLTSYGLIMGGPPPNVCKMCNLGLSFYIFYHFFLRTTVVAKSFFFCSILRPPGHRSVIFHSATYSSRSVASCHVSCATLDLPAAQEEPARTVSTLR